MSSMRVLRTVALLCAVSVSLMAVAGCASILPPDAAAMMKIATGKMNKMTGAEIQALASHPIVVGYAPNLQLTDAQADAIARFLADNNIRTLLELQALLQRAQTDPGSVVLPEGFAELFGDLEVPEEQA